MAWWMWSTAPSPWPVRRTPYQWLSTAIRSAAAVSPTSSELAGKPAKVRPSVTAAPTAGWMRPASGTPLATPKKTHRPASTIMGISMGSGASRTAAFCSERLPKKAAWPSLRNDAAVKKEPRRATA